MAFVCLTWTSGVINNKGSRCSSVIGFCDGSVALLPRSVPDLSFDLPALNLSRSIDCFVYV